MKIRNVFLFVTLFAPLFCRAEVPGLPEEVSLALAAAGIQESSLSATVAPLDGKEGFRLSWRSGEPRQPASIMKVVTTAAAMDLLGPGKRWKTDFLASGPVEEGAVRSLHIRAGGAPWMPADDLRSAVAALRALGLREIRGDALVDRSVFREPPADPAAFDKEPFRPYNQGHEALALGIQSVTLRFLPGRNGEAVVVQDPLLSGYRVPAAVRLGEGDCPKNLTRALKPEVTAEGIRFTGTYPSSCGADSWSFVPWGGRDGYRFYDESVFRASWKNAGGIWNGRMSEGPVPGNAVLLYSQPSKPLSGFIRDINKNSINPIARNLFLSLSDEKDGATLAGARLRVSGWFRSKGISPDGLFIENGSGLSRTTRASTEQIGAVLALAGRAAWAPEFISSLPFAGEDGTMRNRPLEKGSAHVKTGYIRGVRSVAGYVLALSGRWYTVCAIVNDPAALGAKPALDALLEAVAEKG